MWELVRIAKYGTRDELTDPLVGVSGTLHFACENGHTDLVRKLVRDYGLGVNVCDALGAYDRFGTPLHAASAMGHH